MSLKKFFGLRINILLVCLVFALLAINFRPWVEGIEIKTVDDELAKQGISSGQIIKAINDKAINTISDFEKAKEELKVEPVEIKIRTNETTVRYNITGDIRFRVENLTIISVDNVSGLKEGMLVKAVNDKKVKNDTELYERIDEIIPRKKISIQTDSKEYIFLATQSHAMTVGKAETSNIVKGLDLEGGTRVLLQPVVENGTVTDNHISDLIKVLSNRLNVYGLADLRIRSANDWEGNKFVLIEIAGATREEVRELIAKQGKFEARIGNETVFVGGKNDVPFVCRNDGSCSGIRVIGGTQPCAQVSDNQWYCKFEFRIKLSGDAAARQAGVTKELDINVTGGETEYLSKSLDLYLDDQLVDSLLIGADLKGKESTDIVISGPGYGTTQTAAYNDALKNMDKLQTILITGSLPLKLNIVKLDSISPTLGQQFIKNSFFVGMLALAAVICVVFVRYRNIKIVLPLMITSISEIILILGFAAWIQWNLDLASIAGIIAAVGTGIDSQIVIVDEIIKGQADRFFSWKQRIKRAFFIVMVAWATTIAAMIPLMNAGAGLVRGFAVTTMIGVTIGVFITRPAFASMIEKLIEH